MLCVLLLYMSGGTYSLKSTPNDRLFRIFYMTILFTLTIFAERQSPKKYLFCLTWGLNCSLNAFNVLSENYIKTKKKVDFINKEKKGEHLSACVFMKLTYQSTF